MPSTIPPRLNLEQRLNFRNLYFDIAWFGLVAGSTMAFLNIFAARLGATSFQLGLLIAGPAVINLLFSLPAGRWLENKSFVRVTFWSSIVQRFGFLLLVPLPLLLSVYPKIWSIILITLFMALPGTILAISFNALFADLIPPEHRSRVVGQRNVLVAVSVTLTTLLSGQVLDRISDPYNFMIVFSIGVLGAGMSSYHLGRLKEAGEIPPRMWKPLGDLIRPGMLRFIDAMRTPPGLRFLTRAQGRQLLRLDLLKGPFGAFLGAYFIFYTFQYLPLPLLPLYFVDELKLSNGAISLGLALFHLLMVAGSLRLSYITVRLGSHQRVLIIGAFLYGLYPLLVALARDATLFWGASIIGGFVWALLNGGLVNRLMERVPEDDRPAHMALHNLVLNLGILLGSLSGPLLGEWIGLRDALLISTALRVLAGFLLIRWG
jgi:predicted MFS family arabinose efflux permease